MKKIAIEKPLLSSGFWSGKTLLRFCYCAVLVLSFSFFAMYARFTGRMFSSNKIDIFNDLQQLAVYFRVLDPELADQLLTFDDIIKSYQQGENILKSKEQELLQLRDYARNHQSYLGKIGFSRYHKLFELLDEAREIRDEILELLWKHQTFNYLIPLQNSNEIRPNWGFFGSFAFVSLSGGHIDDLQVVDSYLPDYIAPNARVDLPQRIQENFETGKAGFIAGNKYGFTDKDGKNLKTLYEKIFHYDFDPERKAKMFNPEARSKLFGKNIKGVVFLDSALISELLPSFRSKAREWQFVNANIDIIRGENRSNKKELYIKDLNSYLKEAAIPLTKAFVNNFEKVLEQGYINIFFSNVSPQMRGLLDSYNLTTVYKPDFVYFWNINTSYNKSDGFVKRQVEIQDSKGKTIFLSDKPKIPIKDLLKGNYTFRFHYTLDVPKSYQDEMFALEAKYGIEMTDREKYILALQNYSLAKMNAPLQWANRALIYFPQHWEIGAINGDAKEIKKFKADFAQGVSLISKMESSPHSNEITIQVSIP